MADPRDADLTAPGSFEWDSEKDRINRAKHGIGFDAAIEIFQRQILLRRSDRNQEERWTALGETDNRLSVMVFTWRGDAIRIISARRARKNEERDYRNATFERPPGSQD